jgi:hypothetical protein
MRIRLIANEERFIPLIGKVVGVDEVFEVSDEVFESRVWPEDTFEIVASIKTTAKGKE